MASNKIKFKMSIKEVNFEFEGDYEQGRAIQQGISKTLTGIANLQSQAMGGQEEMKALDGKVVGSNPLPTSRRKRRRQSSTAGGDAGGSSTKDEPTGDELPFGDGNDTRTTQRSTGISPTALLTDLVSSGFFDTAHTAGAIKDELHRKGFTVRPTDLTSPLIALTRQNKLQRNKDTQLNQWVYKKGGTSEI